MVRVRIELTAFALSDHALPAELKDPTRQLKTLKHGIMQMEEGMSHVNDHKAGLWT